MKYLEEMSYNGLLGALRTTVGLGLLAAVVWQVTDRILNDVFRPTEYFAYFSILTAIFAGFTLFLTGLGLFLDVEDTRVVEIIRLTMTVSLVVVGVVYHLLLADAAPDIRDAGYEWPVLPNDIIHTYSPVLIVVDYLASLRSHKVRLRAAWWVAVFPLAWLFFSIIRGVIDGWWPYWFINPSSEGGLAGMFTYIGAITAFFLTLGFLTLGIKLLLKRLVPQEVNA